ncbi:DUF4157 domain-containing protein [Nocardioides sp. GCM10028917]|uniref:eCIS core domain-containing protein n=1 Tax=Nocardioides sp. GCM10028917 TaxID=3273408 RepID=UPI0036228689
MSAPRERHRCPQPRLKVAAARGPAETEADRVATEMLSPRPAQGRRLGIEHRLPRGISRAPKPEGARRALAPPRDDNRAILRLGTGVALPSGDRAFFEPRFGVSFARVRIHTDPGAAAASDALGARAFTTGRDIVFGADQYRPGSTAGRHLLAHELAHSVQQASDAGSHGIQRAMKFELQNKSSFIHAWDEATGEVPRLPRKFGSRDYIYKGASGARMESETNGQVEFETEWERKWPKLAAQLKEAFEMTQAINAAPTVRIAGTTYHRLPAATFPIPHLRPRGWRLTRKERKKGKTFEDNSTKDRADRPLKPTEHLVVDVKKPDWPAYIQISESMEMSQYPSLMRQYELDKYDPSSRKSKQKRKSLDVEGKVTSIVDGIIDHVTKARRPRGDISDLRGFLELVVNLVIRGQYPASSPIGKAAKYTFAIMSRTHLGSVHKHVLTDEERALFRRFVADAQPLLLDKLGLTTRSKFFVHGHGGSNDANPEVLAWLKGLTHNRDLLSALHHGRGEISGAMGKFRVDKEEKEHKGMVRFEVRITAGNVAKASKWEEFGKTHFLAAMKDRPRPAGKGETGLTL